MASEWLHYQIPPRGETENDIEFSLFTFKQDMAMGQKWPNMTNKMWLGDSGASCHMCNDDTYMYDWKPIDSNIKIGDGKLLQAQKIGKLKLTFLQASGQQQQIVLQEV